MIFFRHILFYKQKLIENPIFFIPIIIMIIAHKKSRKPY